MEDSSERFESPHIVTDIIDQIWADRHERVSRTAIFHKRDAFAGEEDFRKEQMLNDLMRRQERDVIDMERFGLNASEMAWERQESDVTKELRKLLLEFGIAKMITAGDWIINRQREIPDSMGLAAFPQLMGMISEFVEEHGEAGEDTKLIAADLGCGNGEFCEFLRGDSSYDGKHQWEIFGYADFIYFTLNDFLKNLVEGKHKRDPALMEFVDVISTLLIRKIHSSYAYSGRESTDELKLQSLRANVNVIREILPELDAYIKLRDRKKLRVDVEFLSDAEKEISEECQTLIAEYFESPEDFIDKYFINVVKDLPFTEIERLRSLETQIVKLERKRRPDTARVTRKMRRFDTAERIRIQKRREEIESGETDIKRITRRITEKERIPVQIQVLRLEKLEILAKIPDLSEHISLYPFNVIPGKFDELREIFPESSTHFIWSKKATSHQNDQEYVGTFKQIAGILAPGGVFADDGQRESWTRYERIGLLETLQDELGKKYKISIVADGKNVRSVLLERGIVQEDDNVRFPSEHIGEKMLNTDCDFLELKEWMDRQPENYIRNRVIEKIRRVLLKSSDGLGGRMHFKEVHQIIERELQQMFGSVEWQYLTQVNVGESPDIDGLARRIATKITLVVKEEVPDDLKRLFEWRAVPIGENAAVQTFERLDDDGTNPHINTSRVIPVNMLPRNLGIPSEETLNPRRMAMVEGLSILHNITGAPPIDILEFDDCFTNPFMLEMLRRIIDPFCFAYDKKFEELVRIRNVKLKSGEYPNPLELGPICFVGGSLDSASDEHGKLFIDKFCKPFLEKVNAGKQRGYGSCFGSDVLVQAMGQLKGGNPKIVPGALQYGAFPITFTGSHRSILRELTSAACTVSMTRQDYSLVDGLEKFYGEIEPFAYEMDYRDGRLEVNKDLPPVGFSLFGGKLLTAKWHSELSLREPDGETLNRWLHRSHDDIRTNFLGSRNDALRSPSNIYTNQFDLKARDEGGEVQWVEHDIGPLLLTNILHKHVDDTLEQFGEG
jgi:hypothetical protein